MEDLISQARVVVEESVQRAQAYAQWRADREAENLREINRALLTTFDVKQLTDVLVGAFARAWNSKCVSCHL